VSGFTESVVEEAALGWLEALGYAVLHGPDIAAGESAAERRDPAYRDVVLERRLREALARLNPSMPPDALEDAFRKLTRVDAPSLLERNRAAHRMLVDGVAVEYRRADGSIAGAQARVIDFDASENNDWLAVNQFTMCEGQHTRRPDVVLFVNGLALAVIKLKNAADENATVWSAFQQLQTYQRRSRRSSRPTPRSWSLTACKPASDPWRPAGNGSSLGALSAAAATHRGRCPSCKWSLKVCSTSAASSTCCATSSSLRTQVTASSRRRWRAITSFMR
jgi:hypothetical protein